MDKNKDKTKTSKDSNKEELATFIAIPNKRKQKQSLSDVELKQVASLLKTYMDVPSKRALPSKAQLSVVVSSLLQEGARKLSKQWNKTQLVVVIQHWLEVVETLAEKKDQGKTYLKIAVHKGSNGAPKLMKHQITNKEDNGELASMSVSSPKSREKGSGVPIIFSPEKKETREEGELVVMAEPVPMFDESPATFLEQFDRLLADPELAIAAELDPPGETPRNVPDLEHEDPIPENGVYICIYICEFVSVCLWLISTNMTGTFFIVFNFNYLIF